eukprot:15181639-Heterocapsa_arctica.AAC.1
MTTGKHRPGNMGRGISPHGRGEMSGRTFGERKVRTTVGTSPGTKTREEAMEAKKGAKAKERTGTQ